MSDFWLGVIVGAGGVIFLSLFATILLLKLSCSAEEASKPCRKHREETAHMAVKFFPSGWGKAQCPPDPRYPEGVILKANVADDTPVCTFELPYPVPERGFIIVDCERCGATVAISAAGRLDDPVSVTIPCRDRDVIIMPGHEREGLDEN